MKALKQFLKPLILPLYCRLKYGAVGQYIAQARLIEGWTTPAELVALTSLCQTLPAESTIVEIGSFLGRSTVLMAGVRKLQGSGTVHAIDPFDGSGDSFSTGIYEEIENQSALSLRERFDRHLQIASVEDWVKVHPGTAASVVDTWSQPIDLLFLDGDQSPVGVRSAYEKWAPFLKPGGIIAIHNSGDRSYAVEHSGHRQLVLESIRNPAYEEIRCIGTTTIARKINSAQPVKSRNLTAPSIQAF